MGVLDRFEKGIERAVNGAFAKAFRSEVQPVEIASALRRECDDRTTVVGRDRALAPNIYVVELGPSDTERLGEWEEALGVELAALVTEHAQQQRYALVGPVQVSFESADDLDTGVFRVRSGARRPQAPPAAPAPPAYRPAEAPGPPVAPRLEFDGRSLALTAPVTVLGRSTEADLVLDDAGVSRRHAEIRVGAAGAEVVDLGSTNGTFMDGERVTVGKLTDGSAITVGRTRITYREGQR